MRALGLFGGARARPWTGRVAPVASLAASVLGCFVRSVGRSFRCLFGFGDNEVAVAMAAVATGPPHAVGERAGHGHRVRPVRSPWRVRSSLLSLARMDT